MIFIYSEHISIRLTYVFDFIFKAKGEDYKITNSIGEFKSFRGLKINYSKQNIDSSLAVIPEGILNESEIRGNVLVNYDTLKNRWLINGCSDDFSLIFFFLTCYEEYYIKERDEHDRFSAKHSTLYKNERLHIPNVDLIVKSIWEHIGLDYTILKKRFKSVITFDIDSAWAVKNKSKIRRIGSDLKSITKGESLVDKRSIRKGELADPFDTFDIIKNVSKTHDTICFILLGDLGKFDKNIHWKNKNFQLLITELATSLTLGIHPSYKSYLSEDLVKEEINRLEIIRSFKTTNSRQHFLKLKLPSTYEILEATGITDDYSMGFADAYGFRSGTSFSYPFFNLKKNTISNLTVHPITYMDGTLNQYLKLSIPESIEIIEQLKNEVKNVGGVFIPLWHNETIGDIGIWKGWKAVFDSNFD